MSKRLSRRSRDFFTGIPNIYSAKLGTAELLKKLAFSAALLFIHAAFLQT